MLNLNIFVLLFACTIIICKSQTKKPNIVLFLTDDQDVVLDGMVSKNV